MSIDRIENLTEPPAIQPYDAKRVENAIRELLIGMSDEQVEAIAAQVRAEKDLPP